jgi:hypothetical protein
MVATAEAVAQWMFQELTTKPGLMFQEVIVWHIKQHFGDNFTYLNENGNLAIGRDVLREFRKLTKDSVVWDKRERAWRKRDQHDEPSRQQDW